MGIVNNMKVKDKLQLILIEIVNYEEHEVQKTLGDILLLP